MRRSSYVLAPLLASSALGLLAGCRGPEMQRCVDNNNTVVDPNLCRTHYGGGGGGGFHYYYGGRGDYMAGSKVDGGSTEPAAGHSYSLSNGTARGGFGSSFGGDGGGHGGGGEGGGGE